MTPNRCTSETGLSEVVGFVLILGVLVLVFSLYLTYGIPAQGRENEIVHMNEVKDQFVAYKLSLDSLFNNGKVGTTLSNSFTLGTGGGYTQGMISFIPVMSPVSSGGTLAINPVGPDQRVTDNETLTITSQSLILNDTSHYSVDYHVSSPATITYIPSHVYVNISNIPSTSYRNKDGVYGWTVNTTSWIAIINLTPQNTFSQNYSWADTPSCPPTSPYGPVLVLGANAGCLVPKNFFEYTQSDLTISINKNNISTMQSYPVYRNIMFDQTQPYTIDLMNNAYGLSSEIQPSQTITMHPFDDSNFITANGNITYNFDERSYTITPIPLGSIEYQTRNNYWIPQNYYYQMGGVFLRQNDGNTTYKLPPEITFAYDNPQDPRILTVNINALSIDPGLPSNHGVVGGNSPVQVKTTLTNITMMPFVTGSANTKAITICINSTDDKARMMWKNYFDYTAKVALIPLTDYDPPYFEGTKSCIKLNGYDPQTDATAAYDINVIASNATYMTTVHGVGGIVQ
jgi:hypothetical protein